MMKSSQCNEHTACALLGVATVRQMFGGGDIDALQDLRSAEQRRRKLIMQRRTEDEEVAKALVKYRFTCTNKGNPRNLVTKLNEINSHRLATEFTIIVKNVPKVILWAKAAGKLKTEAVDSRPQR